MRCFLSTRALLAAHVWIGYFVMALFQTAYAQRTESPKSYLDRSWKEVATQMPAEWYGTEDAKSVAENVLLYQKEIGGWDKNTEFHLPLSEVDQVKLSQGKTDVGATFDNGATIMEMIFLGRVYAQSPDPRYKESFEKGLDYIFQAQYDNGGWPQFFPLRKGYYTHITYNDNAIVNIMDLLKDVASDAKPYRALQLSSELKSQARRSFDKGIDCILKTQIPVDGKPTVWCAQHDETTLAPAKARAYELESFSGGESVGITLLLMDLDQPSSAVVAAVEGAVKWFEEHQLEGIKIETEILADGKKNRVVVQDPAAPPLWARFYDLESGKPYFCDRDGIKKASLAEIGYERRNGYSWYTSSPSKVLAKYGAWQKKIGR